MSILQNNNVYAFRNCEKCVRDLFLCERDECDNSRDRPSFEAFTSRSLGLFATSREKEKRSPAIDKLCRNSRDAIKIHRRRGGFDLRARFHRRGAKRRMVTKESVNGDERKKRGRKKKEITKRKTGTKWKSAARTTCSRDFTNS